MNDITIDTKLGTLSANTIKHPVFPSIEVRLEGKLVATIECSQTNKVPSLKVVAWNNHPVLTDDWDPEIYGGITYAKS